MFVTLNYLFYLLDLLFIIIAVILVRLVSGSGRMFVELCWRKSGRWRRRRRSAGEGLLLIGGLVVSDGLFRIMI